MKVDMVMPQMGESIAEATIVKWLKNPGDKVEKDEIILEISTDKVDSEIPSPSSGVLAELLFKEGDVVPVKQKIATIDTEGSGAGAAKPAASAPVQDKPSLTTPPPTPAAAMTHAETSSPAPQVRPHSNGNGAAQESDKFFSPLVKGLAEKHGVSLSELEKLHGSGHSGRVTKEDFYNYIESRGGSSSAGMSQATATSSEPAYREAPQYEAPRTEAKTSEAKPSPSSSWTAEGTKVVVMDNMRQAIAEHMVMSKRTSPHVYSVTEVDVTNIAKWRVKNQKEFLDKEGVKLSFTPFFLEAAVRALVQFPEVNASVDGKKILIKKNVNLGCAVALGTKGLIVPVIKRAEEKNFVGIARSLNDLAEKARTKKLSPDDVRDGTFTVTNPGVFGTIIGYPIINQPQAAILSLGAIKKRPMVINDAIAIREMCYLTLSYDHRIIDGSLGGSFLAFIKEYLEGWSLDRPLY